MDCSFPDILVFILLVAENVQLLSHISYMCDTVFYSVARSFTNNLLLSFFFACVPSIFCT